MGYTDRKNWSQQFIPELARIVGPHLLQPTNYDIDAKEATDLIVLNARDLRIACRVRKAGYAERYPYDFTIRATAPGGFKTEFQKIVEGYGDWMIYAHQSTEQPDRIGQYFIIDLAIFRAELIADAHRADRLMPMTMQRNPDGSGFYVFDALRLPQRAIIAADPFFLTNE